jgi:hypothetical protein
LAATPAPGFGQLFQVGGVDLHILRRVRLLEEGLADVVDHVVALPGIHPLLLGHRAEPEGDRLEEAVGVGRVNQRIDRKGPRALHGDLGAVDAVAGEADGLVEFLAALEGLLVPLARSAGVIDVGDLGEFCRGGWLRLLGGGEWGREQRPGRP